MLLFEGEEGKSLLERKAHMTSLKHSEVHITSNSTCFSLGMWESSKESENSQHLYPGTFVLFLLFFAITSLGGGKKGKEWQKLSCSTMGFYVWFFFLCCDLLASACLKKKDLGLSEVVLFLLNTVFQLFSKFTFLNMIFYSCNSVFLYMPLNNFIHLFQ